MDRRTFISLSSLLGMSFMLGCEKPSDGTGGTGIPVIPKKKWAGWKAGQFQVHFIYTGVGESLFFIFPDGTTMLLDCGDHNVAGKSTSVPLLPDTSRHSGEWIARYVQRVNPNKDVVDYMMLSHYHCDHAGSEVFFADKLVQGTEEYALSGFSQAAGYLKFSKAIDRCYPTYDDPLPLVDDSNRVFSHMKKFYSYMSKNKGLAIEKFRLGATDQIVPLRGQIEGFEVRNICGNGRIVLPDGTIKDLYEKFKSDPPESFNENGMSLGLEFNYGPFRFFTAGDFTADLKYPDGSRCNIEEELAKAVRPSDVSKINHHGHNSMPAKLVSALRSKVWVSCVWSQEHDMSEVMSRLADRTAYPGDRLICPGIFPAGRQVADEGKSWVRDLAPASFEGGHVVLNVEEGGSEYSITYLDANSESMYIRNVAEFKTFDK